jgi:hypothetical protein
MASYPLFRRVTIITAAADMSNFNLFYHIRKKLTLTAITSPKNQEKLSGYISINNK